LTVYERKSFGNEKIFEKRLNLRKHRFSDIDRFEMHPNGGFLILQFSIKDYDYTDSNIALLFNLNA